MGIQVRTALVSLSAGLIVLVVPAANAEDEKPSPRPRQQTTVATQETSLRVNTYSFSEPERTSIRSVHSSQVDTSAPTFNEGQTRSVPTITYLDVKCEQSRALVEPMPIPCVAPPVEEVPEAAAAAVAPVVTAGMVASAFRAVPLPGSVLRVQPPEGETLVNFETNFFTVAGPFRRVVVLLGQRVELDIWPESYLWVFGDGSSRSTRSPGAAYPDLEVTHAYLSKGRVAPRVDTTWRARFRVGGGGWRPVAGSVTVRGEPVGLRVLEAQPNLVGASG